MERENAGVYLRVSTQQQDTTNQRRAMTQLAAQRGWQVAWYIEQESGGADERPQYQKWLEDACTGQFTVAAVWALDRLGRGGVLSTLLALHELEAAGCSFVSHQEPWISTDSGPLRELLRPILAWIAQQERVRRRERTLAGLERAKAAGTILGRPRLELDTDAAQALLSKGYSQQRVAELLGVSRSTLQRRLRITRKEPPDGHLAP